jgi:hypothetical protein
MKDHFITLVKEFRKWEGEVTSLSGMAVTWFQISTFFGTYYTVGYSASSLQLAHWVGHLVCEYKSSSYQGYICITTLSFVVQLCTYSVFLT